MTGFQTLRYGAWMQFFRRSVEFEFPDLEMRIKVVIGDQATAKVVHALEGRIRYLAEVGEPLPMPSFPLTAASDRPVRWFTIRTAAPRREGGTGTR